ncbi:type VI secretion protein [Altererythrobacter luteolus]|uniref:Type VI secretion protein n=1 Tax=Pontixanthobacter luteolus TaxID=295089 RepID=A0A6I4UVQ5_9SPHN|nr:TrbC/VirB2 family protein [Pontixanthobacter luteolus]MXP45959.1 type VI secretion protein [Pontixanthobacter luteolus]
MLGHFFASVSLFETDGSQPIGAAIDWITGTALGSLAIGLCVIAVAIVGLLLMTGRLAVRDALRVVLGCFILLGAPVIAGAFISAV